MSNSGLFNGPRANPANPPALPLQPHQAAALALPAALLFGLALVMQLLAAPARDLELGAAFFVEEQFQRHDGHAFALDRGGELVDLALVQQQLARSLRGV